jgi:peptidoglycan hydrolase-like protein with peptidoglycan-binding domain
MEQICADQNYGYDQSGRLTGYNSIVKNSHKVAGAKGEFDCSSLVSSCYNFAGLNISPSNTTRSIRKNFIATGKFKLYMDAAHLTGDKYAKRGGIFLSEGHHVVMALEDGSRDKNPYKEPLLTIKLGSRGEGVKWVQWELKKDRFEIEITGICDTDMDATIRTYQRKHGLEVDGKVGPKTRQSMR